VKDIYIFVDETGDLGYNTKSGSLYFGFGSVTLSEEEAESMWGAFKLRCAFEADGIPLKEGFHAQEDRFLIRKAVFQLIGNTNVKFDFTFLNKNNAYEHVKRTGDLGLYKRAWYLHFQYLVKRYSNENVRLVVVVADIQTRARKAQIHSALQDVTNQFSNLKTNLLVWNSQSSWGLQMADYGTWSAQRMLLSGQCEFWEPYINPKTNSFFKPWG